MHQSDNVICHLSSPRPGPARVGPPAAPTTSRDPAADIKVVGIVVSAGAFRRSVTPRLPAARTAGTAWGAWAAASTGTAAVMSLGDTGVVACQVPHATEHRLQLES